MENEPSHPVSNGERRPTGQFGPGNKFGKGGNPFLRRLHHLKATVLASATPTQVRAVIEKLGEQAAEGDVASAKVYLDHVLGKPSQSIALTGLDALAPGVDLARVRAAILAAVGDDLETRHRIAKALLTLDSGGDGDGSAGDVGP